MAHISSLRHGPRRARRWRSASIALGTAALATVGLSTVLAGPPPGPTNHVPSANAKSPGMAPPNLLTDLLIGAKVQEVEMARGSFAVENPMPTAGGFMITNYGYVNDGVMIGNPEATKTEPDKNTYLVLPRQHGADTKYDYGCRFLYQGHENGRRDAANGNARGCITRINLDADAAHRVTVLATQDVTGAFLPAYDGSTWDPFAGLLLFTCEQGTAGGLWQATPDLPSAVTDISGIAGRGGYEGVQVDSAGNLWIVEDVGGATGVVNNRARQPNSFVYRLVPTNPANLMLGGRLQVLQVMSIAFPGQPIVFHPGLADADILSQDTKDIHTYGLTFKTNWVTIHDTAVDGFLPFDANAKAKAAKGTPFKRPENGMFRPDTKFREFVFTETGDTNALTQAGSAYGGFGALLRLRQTRPEANTGTLSLLYLGDVVHTGFDNLGWLTEDLILVGEDCGDTLHTQRNALDSIWLVDAGVDYGAVGAPALIRVLAEGRDASATFDAGLLGSPGFQNDGDNEVTGVHVSDGDPTVGGLLGRDRPRPFRGCEWRVFWTQQHGDNVTWEIQRLCCDKECDCRPGRPNGDDGDDKDGGRGHDND